jgi:hypothetical protein
MCPVNGVLKWAWEHRNEKWGPEVVGDIPTRRLLYLLSGQFEVAIELLDLLSDVVWFD